MDESEEGEMFEPANALSLAISAVLALIPHPDDPTPSKPESVSERRGRAHAFAQSALESIEIQSELVDSATHPSRALCRGPAQHRCMPLHSKVPRELEGILALLILSVYEYAARGNIAKMRNRAGQAMVTAMEMGLHEDDGIDDEFSEARRRAAWMMYVCVCQGSIVSGTQVSAAMNPDAFTTPLPYTAADPEAWGFFIDAQKAILSATQFIVDLNKALETGHKM